MTNKGWIILGGTVAAIGALGFVARKLGRIKKANDAKLEAAVEPTDKQSEPANKPTLVKPIEVTREELMDETGY